MKFNPWSVGHYFYIILPFIVLFLLWSLLKNKDQKTKTIVGYVIGSFALFWLVARNVDIYLANGFDPDIIPLQVCHFGCIVVFLSLIFKNKTAATMGFYLNLPAAYASFIVTDVLAEYDTIFEVLPLSYIFIHLFVVVGAVYPVMFNLIKIDKTSIKKMFYILLPLFLIAMAANVYFFTIEREINYFYALNTEGAPFGVFEGLFEFLIFKDYGFDLTYSLSVFAIGLLGILIMHKLYKYINKKRT